MWLIQGYVHRHAREQLTGQSKQRSRVFIPQFYPVDSFRVFREGCRCKPVIISIIPPWWLITAVVRVVASLRIIIFFLSPPFSGLYSPSLSTSVLKQDEWKRIDMNAFSVGSYFWPFVHLNYFCKLNQKNIIEYYKNTCAVRVQKKEDYILSENLLSRIQFWLINLISGYPIAEEFKRMNFKLLYRFGEIGIYNFAG